MLRRFDSETAGTAEGGIIRQWVCASGTVPLFHRNNLLICMRGSPVLEAMSDMSETIPRMCVPSTGIFLETIAPNGRYPFS
jgi:hypothetical protein